MFSEEDIALIPQILPVDVEESDSEEEEEEAVFGGVQSIPFSVMHNQILPFDDPSQSRLLPGHEIHVEIVNCICDNEVHLYPYLYVIHLSHAHFQWIIKRRYKDFSHLYNKLLLFYASLIITHPTLRYKKHKKNLKGKKIHELPSLPHKPDYFIKKHDLPRRREGLETFLLQLLRIDNYRCYHETLEFLEIGPFSFVDGLGSKRREGFILKLAGGCCHKSRIFKTCFSCCCRTWRTRWLMTKDNFIAYINPGNGHVRGVLLVDKYFAVKAGKSTTGYPEGLLISNDSRNLLVRCSNEQDASDWCEEITRVIGTTGADFAKQNVHDSFVPVRSYTECKWIVDGATYFEAVATALEKAKEEIFITGWWLIPEFYMKRPTTHGHYWQLDYILKRKANQGVNIFIILYKEVELALGIHSAYSERKLTTLHKNIKVLRHPTSGVFLWAHHEKIVCIDQAYSFVGGLDICYGRWDDFQHRLTDLGEVEQKIKVHRHMSTLPLAHLPTPIKRTTSAPNLVSSHQNIKLLPASKSLNTMQPEQFVMPSPFYDRKNYPRKMSRKSTQQGKIDKNIWRLKVAGQKLVAFTKLQKNPVEEFLRIHEFQATKDVSLENLPTAADIHRTIQEIAIVHLGIERKFRLWHGKDYTNFINKDITKLNEPYTDNINRLVTPRMPWHDVALFVQGSAARDIGRHFIQRWNYTKIKKAKGDYSYPYLLPKAYTNIDTIHPLLTSEVGTMYIADCQVLRSLSHWSGGIGVTENSIHNAYISTITKAEHFIYIENQFFVTQPSHDKNVFNGIADALYNKIIEAHSNHRVFRVYVVMPLLPAFEGEVGTGSGTLIQAITHWNYKSMCRGPTSLYQRLSQIIKDPTEYISFFGLRTHGILNNKLVTELIYVHSKLLIVDDRFAIIGSANINDRSMLGQRDSEIAVLVHDTVLVDSIMNGKKYQVGSFCSSLRKALFREHLGMFTHNVPPTNVQDPVSERFFRNLWYRTASRNTAIYEQVFHCIPTNNVQSFKDLKTYQSKIPLSVSSPAEASLILKDVRGYLVLMPLDFLCNENLAPTITVKERFLPNCVWT